MTSLQTSVPDVDVHEKHDVNPKPGRVAGFRAAIGGILIVASIAVAIIGGAWSLVSTVKSGAAPARVGEPVKVSGGVFQVDRVVPESMAPMQMENFAKSGMFMSGMVADMTPEGKKRFTLEVSLSGGNGGLRFSENDFRVNGEGMKETRPLRGQLGTGKISSGQATSGILTFQVPEEAEDLVLGFRDSRPVILDLGSETENPNKSGGGH